MEFKNYPDSIEALRSMTDDLITAIIRNGDGTAFHLALSGGGTAKQMFALWTSEYKDKIPWQQLYFYWVDERCVAPTDDESNYGHARKLLFDVISIPDTHVFRIKGEDNPEDEAQRYAQIVSKEMTRFDAIILGVGADAHTASIFPNTMQLLTDERLYAVSRHPVSGQQRVTMTGTCILGDIPLFVPIIGKDKAEMISKLKKGYSTSNPTPAAYILNNASRATVYTSL